jgi:hypothetical protein
MIFDGTIPKAKEVIPRRVRLETEDDVAPLRALPEVKSLCRVGAANEQSHVPGISSELRAVEPHSKNGPLSPALSPSEGEREKGGASPVLSNGSAHWELELAEHADPQAILQTCFARGIRLRSFNQSDPTLHEVFMRLVGPEAKEASFR